MKEFTATPSDCTMDMFGALKEATLYLEVAQNLHVAATHNAKRALAQVLVDLGGTANTFQLQAASGLSAKTIRELLIHPLNNSWPVSVDTLDGKTVRIYKEPTHVYATRKFALVNDDGTVNPDVTRRDSCVVNVYTIQ